MEMSRTAATLPLRQPGVICNPVEDGAVLLQTEDEIYFGLNRVGLRIWELLGESDGFDDLCTRLAAEYPEVKLDVLRADVRELLEHLERERLVIPAARAETDWA